MYVYIFVFQIKMKELKEEQKEMSPVDNKTGLCH